VFSFINLNNSSNSTGFFLKKFGRLVPVLRVSKIILMKNN
jgi:hypothetical protein